jgi:membrane-associated protein
MNDRYGMEHSFLDVLLGLVRNFGLWIYILLFAYCALKSGALPLFAGYAAQANILELLPVVVASFVGEYLGDELRFAIARRYEDAWSNKWQWLEKAMSAAKVLVARYGWAYVFLYRYPKGMRAIGALPMGLGSMSWYKFTALNAASACLWTFILVGVGYLFGTQIEQSINEKWGIASVALLVLMASGIIFAWHRINRTI